MRKKAENNEDLMELFIGLVQATRFCRQDEAFCEGVTFHQFLILDILSAGSAVTMSELVERLGVAKSTGTRLVNPLVEKKLVGRFRNAQDARSLRLLPTARGREVHRDVLECLRGFLNRVEAGLPARRKSAILRDVRRFIEAIQHAATSQACCVPPSR